MIICFVFALFVCKTESRFLPVETAVCQWDKFSVFETSSFCGGTGCAGGRLDRMLGGFFHFHILSSEMM